MPENVILVDEHDRKVGLMEKLEAHREGLLHRCFSIVIRNARGELLIHRRALDKYHCGGLWTNACCSHQRDGESTLDAAHRRLKEEMGFDCPLEERFSFVYRASFDNGLTEHEYDHVLLGTYDGPVAPDPVEAAGYAWVSLADIRADLASHPDRYTVWFVRILEELERRRLL